MTPTAFVAPTMTLGRQAMRALAVNLPLAASVVAAFAGIHTLAGYTTAAGKRRAFVRTLLADSSMPNDELLAYMDSRDPISKARAALAGELSPDLATALRKALAAAI